MEYSEIVPYPCVYIDASYSDIFKACRKCLISGAKREATEEKIRTLWTTYQNPNHVLPCLSVRTGLDLFLRVMSFPPGTEVIMSAINIPDISRILHHHNLRIVPLDVDLETTSPKLSLLPGLITEKTRLLLLAHIYGKMYDAGPYIKIARQHNIMVIEDLAEGFMGFDRLGHPDTDLSLFSFGVIKFATAFGGAVVKIKDQQIYDQMLSLYNTYPEQSHGDYMKKLLKYCLLTFCLNTPTMITFNILVHYCFGRDLKGEVVSLLRGFPNQLISRLRHRPCTALLETMLERFERYTSANLAETNAKGDYISERLTKQAVQVGNKAETKNYWLFPILVNQPDEVLKLLNAMGIDAYRGATQLNMVEPDNGQHARRLTATPKYPHEAKYIMDHILYLPVNRLVPFTDLDRICRAVSSVLALSSGQQLLPHDGAGLKLKAKL